MLISPLTGGRHLVVVGVHPDVEVVGQDVADLAAQPLERVVWPGAVVPFLEPDRGMAVPRLPRRLDRVDRVAGAAPGIADTVGGGQEPDVVEDEELNLGPPVGAVVAGLGQVLGGPSGDAAGVVAIPLAAPAEEHIGDESTRAAVLVLPGDGRERGGVGEEDHVRLVDGTEAPHRGTVELGDPHGEGVRLERVEREVHVVVPAEEIGVEQLDPAQVLLAHPLEQFFPGRRLAPTRSPGPLRALHVPAPRARARSATSTLGRQERPFDQK
jgi:hypothetical protein